MTREYLIAFGSYGPETGANVFLYLHDGDTFKSCCSFCAGPRPSYVLFGKGNLLYVVNECNIPMHGKQGGIRTYRISPGFSSVELVGEISSDGEDPCSLCLSPDGLYLLATNYSSGSFVVFELDMHGIPHRLVQKIDFKGSGPIESRQASSHPHSAYFDTSGKTLYIADLGTDTIATFHWDNQTPEGPAIVERTIRLTPGDGPRLVRLSEDQSKLFVVNELSNSVAVLSTDTLERQQTLGTMPTLDLTSTAGHMEIRDGIVFVSNRGDDTIAVIQTGRTTWYSSGGTCPRFFAFVGDHLYVLNQESGGVCSYLYQEGVLSEYRDELTLPNPTCLQAKPV